MPVGVSPPYGGVATPSGMQPTTNQPPTIPQQPMVQQQPPAIPQQPMVRQQPPMAPPQNQQPYASNPPQNQAIPPTAAGNPPAALDGYCPVSLIEKQKWVAGDRRWGMYHRGRLYYFAGPEEQRRFDANPDRYAPAVAGNDIVLAGEGQIIPGRREFGVYCGGQVYLFSSAATRAKFEANPAPYVNQALQALRSGAYHPGAGQWR
jgi:YHS domain-containing protein